MKQTKNAPKNRDFFTEHGGSLSAYGIIGFLGQSLSGASLAYAVFALLVAQIFADGHAEGSTVVALIVMAVTVGFFVELSNRVLARRAIRPFVVKDLFAGDPDAAKRHKILNRSYLVGLVSVALLSYFFSIVGSTYYANDVTTGPELVPIDSIAQVYAGQELATLRTFAADSATVAGPYDVQLGAARAGFAADSSALMRQRTDFYGCARRGNGYCTKMRRTLLTNIDTKRAELASVTAKVSRERAAVLSAALAYRDGRLSDIRTAAASATAEAKAINRAAGEEKEADAGFKGLVFIILTVAGQTLFYFMVYLQLQVEAGSEIEHELQPNEFWGLPTVVQEFRITAAWRIERGARRLIRWLFGEPNDGHNTAIPYANIYGENDGDDDNDDPVTNGPVIAVDDDKNDRQTIVVDSAIKQCRNCGKDFRPKAHNHAYCTTACKSSYHTKKNNGRAFDPGKYRGRKPSKA
jgi:hypothetical protein